MIARPYDGFLPGQHLIDGCGAGGFSFAGMSHRGSLLALPSGILAWDVKSFDDITMAALAPLLDEPRDAMELVLIGTGAQLRPLPRALRAQLNAAGLRCDTMATHHAVATYNILLGEKRRVAAVLVAVS